VLLNNAKNVLNIHKGNFVLKDAQTEETLAFAETTTLYPEVPSEAKRVSEVLKASFFSSKTISD
jgi:hypothetical protein